MCYARDAVRVGRTRYRRAALGCIDEARVTQGSECDIRSGVVGYRGKVAGAKLYVLPVALEMVVNPLKNCKVDAHVDGMRAALSPVPLGPKADDDSIVK